MDDMAIKDIKAFSDKARTDEALGEQLRGCQKIKELLILARESGFPLDEVELYPPNEPQFTADQLSERLVKALLRA
jgi:predicted ribosomally synthesized peptide with nif11-like leader